MTPYQRIQLERSLRNDYSTDSKNYAEIKRQSAIIKAALPIHRQPERCRLQPHT